VLDWIMRFISVNTVYEIEVFTSIKQMI